MGKYNKLKMALFVGLTMTSIAIFGQDHADEHESSNVTEEMVTYDESEISAELDEFPTLHPLVVHFPIVLLLMAAMSQIAGLFFFKKALSWVTLCILVGGFLGALIAGNYVHPHLSADLSARSKQILKAHEDYANYTVWLSGSGLVLKLLSHFFMKQKMWLEMLIGVVLICTAYTISKAGHYGAQLTHLENVKVEAPSEDHGH